MGEFSVNRRQLLRGSAQTGLAVAVAGVFNGLMSRQSMAAGTAGQVEPAVSPYGPLFPVADQETGLPLLKLPRGFTYRSFSWRGDLMDDGQRVPEDHDGMGVVSVGGPGNRDVAIIRNHEIRDGATLNAPAVYSPGNGGGCTVLKLRNGKLVDHRATIGGTRNNCAGGVTPWGTWLTCEENFDTLAKDHGYVFECAVDPAQSSAEPIIGMGRLYHEAVAVDPDSGYVYETEDRRNVSGFYRYKPNDTSGTLGSLAKGGTLQAAKVVGADGALLLALGGSNAVDHVGQTLDIEWVDIEEPNAPPQNGRSGPYLEAVAKGALTMSRGEGIWYHGGEIAVVDTAFGRNSSGSDGRGLGGIWIYTPSKANPERGSMKLIYAAAGELAGNNPDNVTFSPRGGLLTCDDGDAVEDAYGKGNRLMGYTAAGEAYIFAKNNVELTAAQVAAMGRDTAYIPADDYRGMEFAGATFDPTGHTLFVNIQTPGITFAIRGPWTRGNL